MTRYLVLAYALFVTALVLLFGLSDYSGDNFSFRIYGYGRFHHNAVYLTVAALVAAAGWNFVQWRKTGSGLASTSIHFVLAGLWYVLGVAVMAGTWVHPASSGRVSVFGQGRFEPPPVYMINAVLFAVAVAHLRWWRKAGRPGVTGTSHFALANAFFLTGVVLALGVGDHPASRHYATFYGYGKAEEFSAYLAIGLLFTAAFWNVRQWRKAAPAPVEVPPAVPPAARPIGGTNWPVVGVFGGVLLLVLLAAVPTGVTVTQPPGANWPDAPPGAGYGPAESQLVVQTASARLLFIPIVVLVVGGVAWVLWRLGRSGTPTSPGGLTPGVGVLVFAWGAAGLAALFITRQAATENRPDLYATTAAAVFVLGVVPTVIRAVWINQLANGLPANDYINTPTPLHAPPPTAEAPRGQRVCPQCHAPIAADAPQGLCPRCLMAGAFQSILSPSRTGPYAGTFESPTPEEVQEFFPNLEILGLLGQGGMGAVYQARQPNLDRVVAVKLIRPREDNPTFAERFVREARAMAKLAHPNIVHIHESGEAGGSLYLIMEFVDGVTLREAIRAKALPPGEAMKVVGQLCEALEYAHAQGVVHRDIKPENILIDRAGRVKVVDFGLAKLANDNAVSLTHTRQAMGTPHYMAPEQWEKPTEVDHRADIYALGVVIYELLTGELPLGRFDPPSVKARLDARIDEIVLRLLAKEPEKRFQKASDVRTALFNLGAMRAAGTMAAGRGGRGFYEYRSRAEYLGWPLLHVVAGIDPRTGTPRVAKGWVAVGDVMAVGGLAVSGVCAVGVASVAGVVGIGLLALAGALALGGVAVGGIAVGVAALGGVAVGWLAVGGVAVGKYALGGAVVGKYTNRQGALSQFWERLWDDVVGWF